MSSPLILGVDPGFSGAYTLIFPDDTLTIYDMPTYIVSVTKSKKVRKDGTRGTRTKRDYNRAVIASTLRALHVLHPDMVLWVEKIWAVPAKGDGVHQGAQSIFDQGRGYEMWLTMAACLKIRLEEVAPVRWKKEMMKDCGEGKAASVKRAQAMFPGYANLFTGPRGGALDGRADSALIAKYGQLQTF